MKNIDMLAKACTPDPAPEANQAGDFNKLSTEIVDKIAARVIELLSQNASDPQPDPTPADDPQPPAPAEDPAGGDPDEDGQSV